MTRAEWRIFRFNAIRLLAKRDGTGVVDGPAWLQDEVRKFTPAKWVSYFDKTTGRKKELPPTPEPGQAKRKVRAMSGKNLFSRSGREAGKSTKRPRNSN